MIDTMLSEFAVPFHGEGLFPYHDIGPQGRAPRVALVADLHGNELNGMFVLSRLAAFLRNIGAGGRSGLRLRERVVIVPTINTVESRGAESAMSRTGPGDRRSLWATAAEALLALTRAAYYRVDIRQASLDIEEMPQVRLYAPSDDERATACLFGLPAVIEEQPKEHGVAPGLTGIWRRQGGENFSIHAGQPGSLQTRHCEMLFGALVSFLDRAGIVSGLRPTDQGEELRYFGPRQLYLVRAEQAGIFASGLDVGRWVRAGEQLGQIYDSFTGGVRMQVLAPVAGLLASLRRQPPLGEGELLARILVPDRAVERESPAMQSAA